MGGNPVFGSAPEVFRGVVHEERVLTRVPVAIEHSLKDDGVGLSGLVVRGGKHVFAKVRHQVGSDFGEVFTDQDSVVGEQGDLAPLLGVFDGLCHFRPKAHHRFPKVDPGLAGNIGSKGLVDEAHVFISGIGVSRFGLPFAIVMPPAIAQLLKAEAGQSGQLLHAFAPAVFVEDIVHVEDEEHDDPSLGPKSSQIRRSRLCGMPASIRDCTDVSRLDSYLDEAVGLVRSGQCVVLPTDTVYGIGCDAFSAEAVSLLLATKGRGRHMPPPVLVGSMDDVETLVEVVPDSARKVMEKWWPGGVTVVFRAHPDVQWDLGDTHGTVAIRMPRHEVALELLRKSGPLAVSSANLTGQPSPLTAQGAYEQLGDRVSLYLDSGEVGGAYRGVGTDTGSTIVDASEIDRGGAWRVVRNGVVSVVEIQAVAGGRWEE